MVQSHLLEFHANICCCVQCFAWMFPDTCQQISFTVQGTTAKDYTSNTSPTKGVEYSSILSSFLDFIYLLQCFSRWDSVHIFLSCTFSLQCTATMLCVVMYCITIITTWSPICVFLYHTWPLTHTSFTVSEIWLHVKRGMKDSTKYC